MDSCREERSEAETEGSSSRSMFHQTAPKGTRELLVLDISGAHEDPV